MSDVNGTKQPAHRGWDQRYQGETYLFGEEPNAFLASQSTRLRRGWKALAIADGEGRNGVWLAERGLDVHSIDASAVAQEKARRLAELRGVGLRLEQVDLAEWTFPENTYDLIAAIFIQFAGPELREKLFEGMVRALNPGGLLLLQGYRPEQIAYGTGGPPTPENLYTEPMLRKAFGTLEILRLESHDDVIKEGEGHNGMSALIDLVARRPG
jgi:SAM-dependent methyltransferase